MSTILSWDQVGDRRYETGIDRGVLYLPDGNVVPWNGLVSVTENTEREMKSYFLDGIKFADHVVPGSYSAKLGAFTYPDELDDLIGNGLYAPGVVVHDQRSKLFHLSYRTREADDLDADAAYKIHIVYNVVAIPGSTALNTLSDTPAPSLFEWSLSATPSRMFGIRPTAHLSLHSRTIDPEVLQDIENLLYGRAFVDEDNPEILPSLPGLPELLELIPLTDGGGGGP
jgi:hypothetical protein